MPDLVAVFLIGLLGSAHCVGMCGPFALLAAAGGPERKSAFGPTLTYSLGRLITYSLIGILFGLLGLALNHSGSLIGWQQIATYLAGILMILVGTIALLRYLGFRLALPLAAVASRTWPVARSSPLPVQPGLRGTRNLGCSEVWVPGPARTPHTSASRKRMGLIRKSPVRGWPGCLRSIG